MNETCATFGAPFDGAADAPSTAPRETGPSLAPDPIAGRSRDMEHALRQALASELAGAKVPALARQVAAMQAAYRSGEPPQSVVLDAPDAAAAYAAYRMPATFAAVRLALRQLADNVPSLTPRSLLDIGAGTGACAWAATDVFGPLDAHLLEQSGPARTLGERLARHDGPQLTYETWRLGATTGPLPTADLATCAYVIGELTEPLRDHLTDLLADAAGTVLVVEPGTPAGYQRVIRVRERLLAHGFAVAAPCPHSQPCPLVDDWCHLPVRVDRSALHRAVKTATLSSEDEKFAYVAATRLPVGGREARVIRKPSVRKGLIELDVCTPEGEARRASVSKRHGEVYKQVRKAGWGDSVPLPT